MLHDCMVLEYLATGLGQLLRQMLGNIPYMEHVGLGEKEAVLHPG